MAEEDNDMRICGMRVMFFSTEKEAIPKGSGLHVHEMKMTGMKKKSQAFCLPLTARTSSAVMLLRPAFLAAAAASFATSRPISSRAACSSLITAGETFSTPAFSTSFFTESAGNVILFISGVAE